MTTCALDSSDPADAEKPSLGTMGTACPASRSAVSALAGADFGTLPGCRATFRPIRTFTFSYNADLTAIYKTLTHVKIYVSTQLQLNALKEDLNDILEFKIT